MIMAIDDCGQLMLERRPPSGIWGGLWSFPEYNEEERKLSQWFEAKYAADIAVIEKWPLFNHDFTHYKLEISPLLARIKRIEKDCVNTFDIEFIDPAKPIDRGVPTPVVELIKRIAQTRLH